MLHHRIPYLSGEAGSVALVHNAAVLDSGPRITMHQPQQRQDMREPTCTRCGGIGFFHTPISDPTTGRIVHLFRCKTCENHQWASDAED